MATNLRWKGAHDSESLASPGGESYHSYQSHNTAPTEYTQYSERPQFIRHGTCDGRIEGSYDLWQAYYDDSRASTETYASTIPSEDELSEDDEEQYVVEEFSDESYRSHAIASTPRDFAELFPSHRRLSIRHDDATIDGNMNLRIDTQVQSRSGRLQPVTLFHLKMHDLKTRDFSLRRYCRESGREVCHSSRKFQRPLSDRRPALQKSFTDAFSTFRHKRSTSGVFSGPRRNDSGYGSFFAESDAQTLSNEGVEAQPNRSPTNTIKLEFANYAHVEVKRRGSGVQRRYCFGYWGQDYTWKRHVRREGEFEEVSYHLARGDKAAPLAYIVPVPLTKEQSFEERLKGGWIPPCSMWISDNDICNSPDVAE